MRQWRRLTCLTALFDERHGLLIPAWQYRTWQQLPDTWEKGKLPNWNRMVL